MELPYRLFGDLYLEDPAIHLRHLELTRLHETEPYFKELETRVSLEQACRTGDENREYLKQFTHLTRTEPFLFNPPRSADELCYPSGDLMAKVAAHLHNPSFTVHDLRNRETADETNPCIWIILQSGITSHNSLIFDHLARRDVVDGLKEYANDVLDCHEEFISGLRKQMGAYVEIVFGAATRDRMHKTLDLEPFSLWGHHAHTPLYLEWDYTDPQGQNNTHPPRYQPIGVKRLKRFILFAHHPQAFTFPWGSRMYGKHQDLVMDVASKLAQITVKESFYSTLKYISKTEHLKLVYENSSESLILKDRSNHSIPVSNTSLMLPVQSNLPGTMLLTELLSINPINLIVLD